MTKYKSEEEFLKDYNPDTYDPNDIRFNNKNNNYNY